MQVQEDFGSAPGRRCILKDARVSTKTSTRLNTEYNVNMDLK